MFFWYWDKLMCIRSLKFRIYLQTIGQGFLCWGLRWVRVLLSFMGIHCTCWCLPSQCSCFLCFIATSVTPFFSFLCLKILALVLSISSTHCPHPWTPQLQKSIRYFLGGRTILHYSLLWYWTVLVHWFLSWTYSATLWSSPLFFVSKSRSRSSGFCRLKTRSPIVAC